MSEAIIVAIITGGLSLIGVVITGVATSRKSENNMKVSQAITDTKLEELTREVRQHNNFAKRMPVVEEQIRVINHRLADLEQGLEGVGMKKLKQNLANLLKVKTIITLVVVMLFAVLALRGEISADNVMIVVSMVVSFYFGTQHERLNEQKS